MLTNTRATNTGADPAVETESMAYRGPYSGPPFGPGFYAPPTTQGAPVNQENIWAGPPGSFPPYGMPPGVGYAQPSMVNPGAPPPVDFGIRRAPSPEAYPWNEEPSLPLEDESPATDPRRTRSGDASGASGPYQHRARRAGNRDEFDGATQFLPPPSPRTMSAMDRELPHLATNLLAHEQDDLLTKVHETLSQCAFTFVARYQFPIPMDPSKRPVKVPADREWTEWAQLLKRLATKRRVPARVLYHGQIKQLVTVLDNSLEMRHAAKHQSRPLKDDRNVLQLVSAGLQVAKILKDASAMDYLDELYVQTEDLIRTRRGQPAYLK